MTCSVGYVTTSYSQATSQLILDGAFSLESSLVYDGAGNLSTVIKKGNDATTILWGYNQTYPIAKANNAISGNTQQVQASSFGTNFTTTATYPITLGASGTISFSIYESGSINGGTLTINYNITGPSNISGSGSISTVGGFISKSYPSMPAGTYNIVFNVTSSNGTFPNLLCTGSYPKSVTVFSNEIYFEGFEQGGWGANVTYGGAHSGDYYFSAASYSLPYVIPDSKLYILQYYRLVGGVWTFTQIAYSGPQAISGPVDDIRVFPLDALMTTFTYNQLFGMTSQTDPSGKTTFYQYDNVGRLYMIRDLNNNIVKQFDYRYQVDPNLNINPNWQSTGALRCKPCPANVSYITNMQQHSERDINTYSASYNATRWVDDNTAGTCVISPDWQAISVSCQQNAGVNTGNLLTIQQDKNPCSSTYNQQQTITTVNTTTCPIPASCSFVMASGYGSPTNSISSSGNTVTFYMVFYSTSTTLIAGNTYTIATINGGCRPSVTRTLNMNSGGRIFSITINPTGQMSIKITSGSNLSPGASVSFSGGIFSL